jgi:hypothetical protein
MTAFWIHEIVDRFWADAGGAPPGFPRDLLESACWALTVTSEPLVDLSIDAVNAWLADHDCDLCLTSPNRRLRACVLVHDGNGVLFLDASDPDDERRFSVAHEIAHYLVEYALPRRRARTRLGDSILPVLEGRRMASWDERIGAVLGGISLGACLHLMERTPDGHLPGREASAAERRADGLAFELLAPFDAVRTRIGGDADRQEVESTLREAFGLPPAPASAYARCMVPEPPDGSLFRRLFSAS